MQYIDAERLKESVQVEFDKGDLSKCPQGMLSEFGRGYHVAMSWILNTIDSLQQEQPEVFDTIAFQKGVQEGRRLEREDIRQEIERRYAYQKEMYNKTKPDGRPNDGWAESLAIMGELEELRTFLDSLSEEPVNEDLEEAVEKQIDEALYKWSYDDEDGIEQYVHDAFIAGAEWQYQKDRYEFAKLKAKEWCNGYDDAISQFVKIPYKPTDWYLTDEEYMCGAQFEEPIPADAELYYRKEDKK